MLLVLIALLAEGAVASLKSEKYGWASIIRVSLSVGLQFPCLGAILLALTPATAPTLASASAPASALVVCLVNSTRRRQALPLHPLPSFRVLLLRKFNAFFSSLSPPFCHVFVVSCVLVFHFWASPLSGVRDRGNSSLCVD